MPKMQQAAADNALFIYCHDRRTSLWPWSVTRPTLPPNDENKYFKRHWTLAIYTRTYTCFCEVINCGNEDVYIVSVLIRINPRILVKKQVMRVKCSIDWTPGSQKVIMLSFRDEFNGSWLKKMQIFLASRMLNIVHNKDI